MAFFDLFVKSLKSNDSVRVFLAAKNLNSVLAKYEFLESDKSLALLRAAMGALQSNDRRPMQDGQARELLSIIIKLAQVVDPDLYRSEVTNLFPGDPTHLEEIPIEELESLIEKFETSHKLMGIKRRRSKTTGNRPRMEISEDGIGKPGSKDNRTPTTELRTLSPEVLYQNVQRVFVVIGYLNTLFKRQNKVYQEYTQNVLEEYERRFNRETGLKVTLVKDKKEPLLVSGSSHYVLTQLLQALRRTPINILEKPYARRITQIETDSESLSRQFNRLMTMELVTQLEGLLSIEKLDKKTEYWQLSDDREPNKKLLRQFRPKGQCMATLYSNKGKLKVLARGKEDIFFSGSDQGEVRVYDFDKFTSESETLLRKTIDVNELLSRPHNRKKHSFSTCPDT